MGVVAAIGLSAHGAGAQVADEAPTDTTLPPSDTTIPPPESTTTTTEPPPPPPDYVGAERRARIDAATSAEANIPTGDVPVHAHAKTPTAPGDPPVPAAVDLPRITDSAPPAPLSPELVSLRAHIRAWAETSSAVGAVGSATEAAAPQPLSAAPVDGPAGKAPAPGSSSTNATVTTTPVAPKATPPASVDPAGFSNDGWVPAALSDEIDQRIAEKWRTAPVRGPPPTTATALGNDARNTTTQVAVVRDQFGHTSVAVSSQTATVHNVGVAEAEGHGAGGAATATGNTSDTSILQVTVIQLRGTGSATVEQSASVDNVGTASATTNGAATATAVGNDSATSVTQIAVVYVEGAGDAHVTQSTAVDNEGVATAEATDRDTTAFGNQSSTDVTQITVVHSGDEDVNVSQTSATSNIGTATATGGTASGNTATNVTTQVAAVHR